MARYRFGEFEFEPEESRLSREDAIVPAQPKVLDALTFFVERAGQLVTREALLAGLWPDTFVNEEALTQTIRKLRRALSDNPREPTYIETVPKRGYRFAAAVEQVAAPAPTGPKVVVPAWLDSGAGGRASAQEPGEKLGRINDLDHLRELLFAGAQLVIGDRFAVGRRVGQADPATLYQGQDLVTGQQVALKMLHRPDPEDIARFQREVGLLQDLKHPGIAPYVAHGTTATGLCFLATQWVPGEPASEWFAGRGPLDQDTFLAFALRVAGTVAYAHERNIIHRDIKPTNLVISDDDGGSALLLDFGLARLIDGAPITTAGTLLGTIGYISPEQVHGRTDIDARSDVFALGCLFFEALCGHPPFQGSAMEIMRALVMQDAPRLAEARPDLDRRLDVLLTAMLAREAELRPSTAADVVTSLGF